MANIYWINTAGGSWGTAANWSIPSDGSARRVPTSTDIVFFNAASGTSATVSSVGASIVVGGLDCTGFLGTISVGTGSQLSVKGNAILALTTTYTGAGTFAVQASATSPTVTTNNANIQCAIFKVFGTSPSDVFTLVGALNCTNTFQPQTCTLAINGNVVTCNLLKPQGTVVFAFGSSGTSAIVIPTGGGANNTTVVDFSVGSGYTSTYSGAQRPILRLTYAGSVGSRRIIDGYNLFDYVWSGADLSNSLALSCRNLDLSNFTGSMLMASNIYISGDLTFNAATKWIASGSFAVTFSGTGTQNIDTKGVGLDCNANFGIIASTFTASISLTTMTVTAAASGALVAGHTVSGTGVTVGTKIVAQLTGATGSTGTYTVSVSQTASSTSMTGLAAGTYVIQNNLALGGTSRATTLTAGNLNLNGKTLNVFNFSSNNVFGRSIAFASGKIIVGGTASAWIATTGTNLSITGPGSIELTNVTTTRVFDGGSVVYSGITLLLSGVSISSLIRGSNSFFSIKNTASPQAIYFTQNTTTTFTDNFELNGTAGTGNNITITTAGTPANLAAAANFAKPSGTVVCSYANISWNNAGYTGTPPGTGPTAAYTSTWATGVGSVLTPNQTSGWTKSAGTAGFITFFYP